MCAVAKSLGGKALSISSLLMSYWTFRRLFSYSWHEIALCIQVRIEIDTLGMINAKGKVEFHYRKKPNLKNPRTNRPHTPQHKHLYPAAVAATVASDKPLSLHSRPKLNTSLQSSSCPPLLPQPSKWCSASSWIYGTKSRP
jgi:hypothetical protein